MIRALIAVVRRALADHRRRRAWREVALGQMTAEEVSDFLHGRPINPAHLSRPGRRS